MVSTNPGETEGVELVFLCVFIYEMNNPGVGFRREKSKGGNRPSARRSSRRRTDASLLQLARCSRVLATYLDVTSTAICCSSFGVEYNWIFAEWALHWLLAPYAFAVWTGMSRIASVWHLRSCTWNISTHNSTVSPRSPRAILWCSSATIDSVWKQRPLWWPLR